MLKSTPFYILRIMHFHRAVNTFFFLVVVIFLIYGNTLFSPWILDDRGNILDNSPIHLSQFSIQSIINAFYAYPDSPGKLYRPVASFSFALNWLAGKENPFGYHVANISIHIVTAFFLYLACLYLVQLSVSAEIFRHSGHSIAFFAALLWAMNPMQTQAVTYIVQRMAALAAMFSVVGIFSFLKARIASSIQHRLIFSLCCLFSFFLALGSKENAIIFPCSLILIECIFFKTHRKILCHNKYKKIFFLSFFLFFFFLLGIIFYSGNLIPGLNYEHRTFTLAQRILTSPRILVFYLSQIFFPISSRLSLEHDFVLSTSLCFPLTTIPSILFCILLITLGFTCRENQLFSFALLFYFLNHSVESTILHLELFFEHRNYLPSLFLFLPIAYGCVSLFNSKKNIYVRSVLIISGIVIFVFLGVNTHDRNQTWSSAITLWQDAHRKAPNSNRAAINLAREYIQIGDTEAALLLFEQSYHLSQPTKKYAQALSLNGQGVVAHIKGNDEKASRLFQQSLEFLPNYREAKKNLILSLCKQHRFQEALVHFSGYTDHYLEGVILLWMNQPEKALEKFRNAQQVLDVEKEDMTGIGKALSMIGSYERADFYLKKVAHLTPISNLIQIENFLRDNRVKEAKIACKKMFSSYPFMSILKLLSIENSLSIPLNRKLITRFIFQQAGEISPIGR
ncbi:MAG: tetratricopeptide repeat protein [Candidatus Electronema sp. V4]|uniref:tetratricopeptide repeat protein n=1 Tax=Candidatus Electronema sp. V4 TaxID=3454756 RepID=UPI0040554C36